MLEGLQATKHSLARSHYWLTRGLLAAEFPPWPSPPLLSQPGPPWLPRWAHVDASLSADAGSTWPSDHQDSPPQVIPQNLPPSSWITRARHDSRQQWEPQSELETRPARHSWLWPALREREKQLIGNVYLTGDTRTGFYKNYKYFEYSNVEKNIPHQSILIVRTQKCGTLHDFACHHCAEVMLIFSVLF